MHTIGISDVTPSPAMLDLKRTILSDGQKRAEDQIEAYNTGAVYYILLICCKCNCMICTVV